MAALAPSLQLNIIVTENSLIDPICVRKQPKWSETNFTQHHSISESFFKSAPLKISKEHSFFKFFLRLSSKFHFLTKIPIYSTTHIHPKECLWRLSPSNLNTKQSVGRSIFFLEHKTERKRWDPESSESVPRTKKKTQLSA